MTSKKPAEISEMVNAFDSIIPGYAWAWHDANASKSRHSFGTPETGGWRDARRSRLNSGRDRCLLVYGMRSEDGAIVPFNRGYLDLARVQFLDAEHAMKDLMAFATEYSRNRWMDGHGAFLHNDACDFAKRTAITLRVLEYISAHALGIEPLWTDGDLTRSS